MEVPEARLTEITFHLMVESAPSAVLLVNRGGKIAYANRQCERLFGYATHELIGQPVEVLIPHRLRDRHPALRDGYFEAPALRSMGAGRELFARRKDGAEFPVEIGLNPLVLVDGVWVLATVIDITARKQAEDRFRRVVDSAPNAMVLVKQSGAITLVNQQATALFGYTAQEMLAMNVDQLLPQRFQQRHGALREGFFRNPQTRYMGVGRDLHARRKNGEEFPVEVGLNPIQTEEGLVALASIVDISERRMQEELRAKKEAAEAAYKAKSELLAIASHDLKNPLASIAGLAEILLDMKKGDPASSPQDVEFLQSILDASRHMSEVVKGILANEGLEQQGLALSVERVDLSALCNDLIRFNGQAAERKNIRLSGSIEAAVEAQGDKTRLREAFDNYVSNAIKYSPPGTVVTVTLARRPREAQVEFGVRDQGPGLTDEDKRHLFEKFRKLSAKPTGDESSTGLGLSIVKAIIELHKGTVGCESQPGQGAYFWARLPCLPPIQPRR